MYYKVYFDINNFHFWSGAKDRMDDATPEQREKVEQRILDCFALENEIPTDVEINDLVWFECDDIFYPEEETEDEGDNDDDWE